MDLFWRPIVPRMRERTIVLWVEITPIDAQTFYDLTERREIVH